MLKDRLHGLKELKMQLGNIKKKILKIVVILLIAIIPLCFLYSLIQLILEPSKLFVVENRKNI